MNENLILEGNTIYELDPVCLQRKHHLPPGRANAGSGVTETETDKAKCQCENQYENQYNEICPGRRTLSDNPVLNHRCHRNRKVGMILGVLILVGRQGKERGYCYPKSPVNTR